MLEWLFKNNVDRENSIIVKSLKSKGRTKTPMSITVGEIKSGLATDT